MVRDVGKLMLDNLTHNKKANAPIAFSVLGSDTLVRLLLRAKTPPLSFEAKLVPIHRTFVGITTDVTKEYSNALSARLEMAVDTTIAPLLHADTGVYLSTQPVVLSAPTE